MRREWPTLCLKWPDGRLSISQHMTWRLVVQYLRDLGRLGEDVAILWFDERIDLNFQADAARTGEKPTSGL